MKEWKSDIRYTDTYWARADNKEEYVTLIKYLFREFDVTQRYLGSEWNEKIHLFNDDLWLWHEYFETDCVDDDKYEEEDLPEPNEYNGEIKYKPVDAEYPVVLLYELLDNKPMCSWYSID